MPDLTLIQPGFTSDRIHVIVLDEDPFVRRIVTRVLEAEGYRVRGAGTAWECLEMLGSSTKISVLIVGLDMRWVDGRELASTAGRVCSGLRILFTASSLGRGEEEALLDHHPLLFKPFGARRLCRMVESLVHAEPPTLQDPSGSR